jgi:hypothetical protein
MVCAPRQIHYCTCKCYQIKAYETGAARGTYWGEEEWGKVTERNHFEDPEAGGRIILKDILK